MYITEFKTDFYPSAREAILDNVSAKVVLPDGANNWNTERYLINGQLYKLNAFDHFNGAPYSLKLRKCKG